jgi:hypothetical protein
VRSSHMYVGQEVQAGTIRRQTTAQPAIPLDGQTHSAAALRASISLSPFAPPSRPLHAASESHVGHQFSAPGVLSCSVCPTAAEGSGRATLMCIEYSLFEAVLLLGSESVPTRAESSSAGFECVGKVRHHRRQSPQGNYGVCAAYSELWQLMLDSDSLIESMVLADTRSEAMNHESDCQASTSPT